MDEWFIITDIDEFTDKARAIVYNNFASWDNEKNQIDVLIDHVAENERSEFDRLLSHQESLVIVKQIVKKQTNKKNKKTRFILNEKLFANIVEDLNSRLTSNIVNSLVQKGLVESAFDEESNDFIFWVKDEDKEKPETD